MKTKDYRKIKYDVIEEILQNPYNNFDKVMENYTPYINAYCRNFNMLFQLKDSEINEDLKQELLGAVYKAITRFHF